MSDREAPQNFDSTDKVPHFQPEDFSSPENEKDAKKRRKKEEKKLKQMAA